MAHDEALAGSQSGPMCSILEGLGDQPAWQRGSKVLKARDAMGIERHHRNRPAIGCELLGDIGLVAVIVVPFALDLERSGTRPSTRARRSRSERMRSLLPRNGMCSQLAALAGSDGAGFGRQPVECGVMKDEG